MGDGTSVKAVVDAEDEDLHGEVVLVTSFKS